MSNVETTETTRATSGGSLNEAAAQDLIDGFASSFNGGEFAPLYTAVVVVNGGAHGHGRLSGRAASSNDEFALDLSIPRELGGPGGVGTNPEQLFAAGYAACFHGAVALVARGMKVDARRASVTAAVTIGRDPTDGGFALRVKLDVTLPGVDEVAARAVVESAKKVCPYSKATAGNIATEILLT